MYEEKNSFNHNGGGNGASEQIHFENAKKIEAKKNYNQSGN